MPPISTVTGLSVRPLSPIIGAEVFGVDLREPLSDGAFADVYQALLGWKGSCTGRRASPSTRCASGGASTPSRSGTTGRRVTIAGDVPYYDLTQAPAPPIRSPFFFASHLARTR